MWRIQKNAILKDLEKKIVFIVGPRQVGKTWLAKEIAKDFQNPTYLNYDSREDREIIKNEDWLSSTDLLILDELHKMTEWKNYLKGVFDTKKEDFKILVTGSARLGAFRQAGDSLAGRFFVHHLLPLSLKEVKEAGKEIDLERMLIRGGFPEPFLVEDQTDAQRWRTQYIDSLIRTDILDFEKIHDFKTIQLLLELLRERVGSSISYSGLANDLEVSPNTIKKYIKIFEALFIIFTVTPYSKNIARSLLKEPKIYFYDNGMVKGDEGQKFENLVAVHLLKNCYGKMDYEGIPSGLHYLKTKEGKEVDFCLVEEDKPKLMIEVKRRDGNLSNGLKYFHEKYGIPGMQLVMDLKRERQALGIELRRAEGYLPELHL